MSTPLIHETRLKAICCILLALFLWIGMALAQHNPLENDEVYSQIDLQNLSWIDIFKGKINEGNNSPLFYAAQKIFSSLLRCKVDIALNGKDICDPRGQIILRILPDLYMSLSLCLIFYFFSRTYNIWIGILALLLALTSPMIWLFWSLARPYGLLVLLTIVQLLLFIHISNQSKNGNRPWYGLCLTHLALCLTSIFGALQVVLAVLCLHKEIRMANKKLFWPLLIPSLIAVFYFLRAPKYTFSVPLGALNLIFDNFAVERLIFFSVCAIWMTYLYKKHTQNMAMPLKLFQFSFLFLAIAPLILAYYTLTNAHIKFLQFQISSRYFIFLTPLSVITTAFFWTHLWDKYKSHPWIRLHLIQGISGLLILGGIRTYVILQRLLP